MRYRQDLQVALRERLRRLLAAHYRDFGRALDMTTAWLSKQQALVAILTEVRPTIAEIDFDAWYKNLTHRNPTWPVQTEDAQAALIWRLMNHLADDENIGDNDWHMILMCFSSSMSDAPRQTTERLLEPLFNFMGDRLAADSNLLYMLERYVRRVEWFERDSLYEQYRANTRQGEEIYDRHLRLTLFNEGVNMPFSQAKSPSGLSDVLVDLDGDEPLVCEVKIFDGTSHPKRNIAAGLNQTIHYAHDHNVTSAHLVIINLSGRPVELPSDGSAAEWPRHLEIGGVRVNLVPVRALPRADPASKLGKPTPIVMTRQELVDPDVA
ncbi:hypothetical protein JOD54_002586 [Actinokineospora baliensis]|uniref:hypothetical protein n=1 Tax=Actinokineospora baliensis TaxID=547056 RepID=UPI001959E56D|nr:hypothetical protein [Actinokineospora baliensis]MBM7772382.1 hypothetical protein [Actinokineospora baliensis]